MEIKQYHEVLQSALEIKCKELKEKKGFRNLDLEKS